jgi:nucleolar complex protein 3
LKAEEPLPKVQRKKVSIPVNAGSDSEDYDIDSLDDLDMDGSDIEFGSDAGSGADEDFDSESDDDEDDEDLMNAYDADEAELDLSDDDGQEHEKRKRKRAEGEADYETSGRSRWAKSLKEEPEEVEVGRLPIKLPTGEVQMVAGTTKLPAIKKKKVEESESEEEEEEEEELDEATQAARMASQRGKFGRMGIAEIVGRPGWKNAEKLEAAKEQIAGIGAEILAGGELIDNVSPYRSNKSSTLINRDLFSLECRPSPFRVSSQLEKSRLCSLSPHPSEVWPCSPNSQSTKILFQATVFDN